MAICTTIHRHSASDFESVVSLFTDTVRAVIIQDHLPEQIRSDGGHSLATFRFSFATEISTKLDLDAPDSLACCQAPMFPLRMVSVIKVR